MSQQNTKRKKGKKSSVQFNSNGKARKYFLFFLFGLSCLLYANTIGHQWAFDDSIVIIDNDFTKMGIKGIPDLVTRDFFEGIYGKDQSELTGGRYRPLSLMMFAVEYQFFGLNPMPGHLINILMHALMILLLFLCLEQWFGKKSLIPYISSLLFLVMPVHTEVVANIKSRDEILCLFLLLSTLYYLFKYLDDKDKPTKYLVISFVSYFLALLAKESAITYLPVFPFAVYIFRSNKFSSSVKWFLTYFGIAIVYVAIRAALVGMIGEADSSDIMENPFVNSSFVEKMATIGVILLKYFTLNFFPHPFTADYSFNHIPFVDFSSPKALLGWAIYLFLGFYAAIRIWKKDVVAFGFLLYLAPLFLISNIVFNIGAPMGERFLFIPSLGFALVVGYLLQKLLPEIGTNQNFLEPLKGQMVVSSLLLVIFVAYGIKTVWRNPDWYDNLTLFSKDINAAPNSSKLRYYLANTQYTEYTILKDEGKQDQAMVMLENSKLNLIEGHKINPKFHHVTYKLGQVYTQLNDAQNAKLYLDKTLALEPNHIKSHWLAGEIYGRLYQNYDLALQYLEKARYEFKDNSPDLIQKLGNVYALKGDHQKAMKVFTELLETDPRNPQYYFNIGLTYQGMGNTAKAEEYFQKGNSFK